MGFFFKLHNLIVTVILFFFFYFQISFVIFLLDCWDFSLFFFWVETWNHQTLENLSEDDYGSPCLPIWYAFHGVPVRQRPAFGVDRPRSKNGLSSCVPVNIVHSRYMSVALIPNLHQESPQDLSWWCPARIWWAFSLKWCCTPSAPIQKVLGFDQMHYRIQDPLASLTSIP